MVKILEGQNTGDKILGWVTVPTFRPPNERNQRAGKLEEVDAYDVIGPFLGNPTLKQSLRSFGFFNGCLHQCMVCYADAAFPSKGFSIDSTKTLLGDDRFINMLPPDSVEVDSLGDIADNPHAVELVGLLLKNTRVLDRRRQKQYQRHKIKVSTSYRPSFEQTIDELIGFARKNRETRERIKLTVSVPRTETNSLAKQFAEFAIARPKVFKGKLDDDGLFVHTPHLLDNIRVHNYFRGYDVVCGRVHSDDLVDMTLPSCPHIVDANKHQTPYKLRGFVETYLNADTPWLLAHATVFESHTTRVFTPITPDNLDALTHLRWNPNFPRPPNWPGGLGVARTDEQANRLREEMARSGKPKKPLHIVGKRK